MIYDAYVFKNTPQCDTFACSDLISPQIKHTEQDTDIILYLQIQSLPEGRSFRRGHSVAFRVQVASYFHGVTGLPLLDVLIHGGLQQVGVFPFWLSDPYHAFTSALDEDRWVCTPHVRPHLLEHCDLWPLVEEQRISVLLCLQKNLPSQTALDYNVCTSTNVSPPWRIL